MKKIILASVLASSLTANAAFTLSVSLGALYTTSVGVDAPTQIVSGGGAGTGGVIGVLVVDTKDVPSAFPQASALVGNGLAFGSNWGNGFYVMSTMTALGVTTFTNNPSANNGPDATGATAALFNGAYNSVAASTAIDLGSATFGGANVNVAHNFALYWFPAITDTNAVTSLTTGVTPSQPTLTAGLAYGFYTNSSAPNLTTVSTNNNPFVTPIGSGAINGRVTQARTEDAVSDLVDSGNEVVNVNLANTTFLADQMIPIVPEPSTYALFFGLLAMVVAYKKRK